MSELAYFLNRFLLQPQQNNAASTALHTAAVLVPIIRHPTRPTLLFTRRSSQLRHHPSQVAFPGGKCDLDDPTLFATALRETHEEIGINSQHIQLMGELPTVYSHTGHCVKPFLAVVEPSFTLKLNVDEVAQVFEVPLTYLLEPHHYTALHLGPPSQHRTVHFLQYAPQLIWGMTATILYDLAASMT